MTTETLELTVIHHPSTDREWLSSIIHPIEHFEEARWYRATHTRLEAMRLAAERF